MNDQENQLKMLCQRYASGNLSEATFWQELWSTRGPSGSTATVDLDRARRCGFPEVVYGPGKSESCLIEVIQALRAAEQPVLATRITVEQAQAVLNRFPEGVYHPEARTIRVPEHQVCRADAQAVQVPVVTAGSADLPVAEEARQTLLWMGFSAPLITDIGVAGPWRLLSRLPDLRQATVIVVVAGMEGALPSVVGGHVSCPVIAVPTSVGYGASLHGLTPLLGMLNSCAANVVPVNIDGGFKAGYVAGLIAAATLPPRRP